MSKSRNIVIPQQGTQTTLQIERVLDGVSEATDQQPSDTGETNQIQIEFGVAKNDSNDPVMLTSEGELIINEAGTYRIKVSLIQGRVGNGGIAKPRVRAIGSNGVQLGITVGTDIPTEGQQAPYSDEAWLTLPAGFTLRYNLMRDSSGINAGGLFAPAVTSGTAPTWNKTACAAIRVERWVYT